MHDILNVDEIVRLLASALVTSWWKATAVALACCCRNFEGPALDELWKEQKKLYPLLETFPDGVWDEESQGFVSRQSSLYTFYSITRLGRLSKNAEDRGMGLLEKVLSTNAGNRIGPRQRVRRFERALGDAAPYP